MKRQVPNIPWEYKWKLIADDLRIERGDLVPRDRMTAAELLDQYDASHTTVRRAFGTCRTADSCTRSTPRAPS